jgi:phage shock protein PspC (stress-responsive transcriptional regulator)
MNTKANVCDHCGRPVESGWAAFSRRLVRPLVNRRVAGVCAGVAQAYGLDVTLLRLLTVVLFFAGFGSIVLVYLAAWIVIPNEYYAQAAPVTFAGSAPVA